MFDYSGGRLSRRGVSWHLNFAWDIDRPTDPHPPSDPPPPLRQTQPDPPPPSLLIPPWQRPSLMHGLLPLTRAPHDTHAVAAPQRMAFPQDKQRLMVEAQRAKAAEEHEWDVRRESLRGRMQELEEAIDRASGHPGPALLQQKEEVARQMEEHADEVWGLSVLGWGRRRKALPSAAQGLAMSRGCMTIYAARTGVGVYVCVCVCVCRRGECWGGMGGGVCGRHWGAGVCGWVGGCIWGGWGRSARGTGVGGCMGGEGVRYVHVRVYVL